MCVIVLPGGLVGGLLVMGSNVGAGFVTAVGFLLARVVMKEDR